MVVPEEEDAVPDVGLGSHGSSQKPNLHLPWHYPHEKALTRHQDILDGRAPTKDLRGHKPLDQGGFFRKPGFSDDHYVIANEPGVEATVLPESFSSLQTTEKLKSKERNKASPSVDLSAKMAKDFEAQLRRSLRIESFEEWMFGTARELVQDMLLKPDIIKDTLPSTLALLVSGVRALRDSNQVLTQLLHNIVLLRRDAYLDTSAKDIPKEHLHLLRRHSLSDAHQLFDPVAVESARRAMLEARQLAVVTNAVKSQRSPRPQTSFSPRGSPHSSASSSRRNNNNRQQWKPNGKGKKFQKKGSPYRPKKGGGSGNGSDK